MTRHTRMNRVAQATLIEGLLRGEMTCQELADETGLSVVTVRRYVSALRRAGACHVAGWGLDSMMRQTIPIYKLGLRLKDAPKPPPMTHTEIKRRYRQRKRSRASHLQPILARSAPTACAKGTALQTAR